MSEAVVRRESDLADIDRDAWNSLVGSMACPQVFMTSDYCEACWQVYREDCQLVLFSAWRDDRLVGVAPFMQVPASRGGGLRVISSPRADFSDLVYASGDLKVAQSLLIALVGVAGNQSIWIDSIPEQSETLGLVTSMRFQDQRYCIQRSRNPSSALLYDGNERRATRMKSLKPQINHFKRQGNYQVAHLTNPEEIHPWLDSFFNQHIERWKNTASPSLFNTMENRQIYQGLVDTLGRRGWLLFSVVSSNDVPLGFHFGYQFDGRLIYYKPTYNVEFASRSPGMILLKELFLHTFDQDFTEFDFSVGDDGYKDRFTNHERINVTVELSRSQWQWRKEQLRRRSNITRKLIGAAEAVNSEGLFNYLGRKLGR